eukprot:6188426-Pleurochrysis_carterae.AAC.2
MVKGGHEAACAKDHEYSGSIRDLLLAEKAATDKCRERESVSVVDGYGQEGTARDVLASC